MTEMLRRRRPLGEYPLLAGLVTATLASGVAISINFATEFVENPFSWIAVGVATVVSGGAAGWASKNSHARSAEFVEEKLSTDVSKRTRSERRSISRLTSTGVVKRRTIETRPDGSRLETIEFFSEELAREENNQLNG